MATPSSQIVATWIKDESLAVEWAPLATVCFDAVRKNWPTPSDDELWDFVEVNLPHISEYLRTDLAETAVDGVKPFFEIDSEQRPYIRGVAFTASDIAVKMRKIDPFDFEKLCASVLERLGAQSRVTKQTNDGGVDFVGVDLKIVPKEFNVPAACRAAVIGQAKRYKDGNAINEVRLREFVGAAVLHRHLLQSEGKIGPLTPVLCAFWTTSSFDMNAKKYARAVGLWYMDGRTLADYVDGLSLRDFVMGMPNKE
jgi:hypothetical protein